MNFDSIDADSDQKTKHVKDSEDVSCTKTQSQEAKKSWPSVMADRAISNLKDKLTDITVSMNSFTKNGWNQKLMTKDRFDEMILKVGKQDALFFEIIKERKLVPDEHLGKYKHILFPEYKTGHPLSLLCYNWATAGCCSIREAFVTKASRLASPFLPNSVSMSIFIRFRWTITMGRAMDFLCWQGIFKIQISSLDCIIPWS